MSDIISIELKNNNNIKVYGTIQIQFIKDAKDGVKVESQPYFNSNVETVLHDKNIENASNKMIRKMANMIQAYQREGSNWQFNRVVGLYVNTSKYKPLKGSSYIDLPEKLKNIKAIINVKNDDDMCFMWSVLAALHPVDNNHHRVSKYKSFASELKFKGIDFPVKLVDIPEFEKQNDISINCFGYDEEVYPLYITKQTNKNKHVDLLYIIDDNTSHYCFVNNFNRLMHSYNKDNNKKFFCKYCLHAFSRQELLEDHVTDCFAINGTQKTSLPSEKDKTLEFVNHKKQLKVPFIIYADFESITEPIHIAESDPQKSQTCGYQLHTPCSFAYKVVCIDNKYTQDCVLYRGEDCIEVFIKKIKEEEEKINTITKDVHPMIITKEDQQIYDDSDDCHICEKPLGRDKVRDHCHITGHFRGAAHDNCNLHFKYPNMIPVVFHNLRGYDSHLIMQHIGKFDGEITCIPNNMEKYISFSLGKLRFIDSLQFLNSSLESLVNNLSNFRHTQYEFDKDVEIKLITKKGVYPYDYMDSWDKFDDSRLPSQMAFYSMLNDEYISDKDYEHAQNVWNTFKIKNMGEYHDLYLKSDVLLLADVFENFRNTCQHFYKLDPAHYYTSPGLAWDAALKMTEIKLELITDIDMYLMVERGIRGGISTITNRYSEANNKYIEQYNKDEESKYVIYLDANNLYGWAMSKYLPTGGFKWVSDIDVTKISDENEKGYILEVDLEYPEELHGDHSDYPLAPENIRIDKSMLSEYSENLMDKFEMGNQNINKLVPNLNDKTKYIVHYRNLKLYQSLGIKVTKIHRVLEFSQSPWLKKYIDFNTEQRKKATNDFEKDFFKLMNNSVFGKTMENLRKRVNVELVNNKERYNKLISKPNYKSKRIFSGGLMAINTYKTNLKLNRPIYCGFAILDNSKMLMYDFHYNYIKNKYGGDAKLLFTDTDSLCYEIKTDDIYEDMYEDKELFDLSNFPKDSKYFDGKNEKVIGKFKSETKMVPIEEFVGLRAKMYSIKTKNNESKRAKGIKRNVVRNNIVHNDYKDTLFDSGRSHIAMNTIRSDKHIIMSYKLNKIGLSCYDDKRYILDNGRDTLAYGHYKIKKIFN